MTYGPFAKCQGSDYLEIGFLKVMFDLGCTSIFFNEGCMADRFHATLAKFTGAKAALKSARRATTINLKY